MISFILTNVALYRGIMVDIAPWLSPIIIELINHYIPLADCSISDFEECHNFNIPKETIFEFIRIYSLTSPWTEIGPTYYNICQVTLHALWDDESPACQPNSFEVMRPHKTKLRGEENKRDKKEDNIQIKKRERKEIRSKERTRSEFTIKIITFLSAR